MLVSLVVSAYLFSMNVWNSSWIPLNPWHCAFLMFSNNCTIWFSFNVNMCALLFTIELKLAFFQSDYWNGAFLSFLCAQFYFVSVPNIKIVCHSVHHHIVRHSPANCWWWCCAFTAAWLQNFQSRVWTIWRETDEKVPFPLSEIWDRGTCMAHKSRWLYATGPVAIEGGPQWSPPSPHVEIKAYLDWCI
jgi:hypothetical protein